LHPAQHDVVDALLVAHFKERLASSPLGSWCQMPAREEFRESLRRVRSSWGCGTDAHAADRRTLDDRRDTGRWMSFQRDGTRVCRRPGSAVGLWALAASPEIRHQNWHGLAETSAARDSIRRALTPTSPSHTFGGVSAVAESGEFDIRSGDGRVLHVYDDGDLSGPLLIYHHGTPLSGLVPSLWAQIARAEGVRLVSFDRAGYGGSDRHPGRRIADVVADTEAVADALDAERFLVFGESGGGPYALGCAALLPARVIAAASMSGPAPSDADGLDFMAGMGQDNIDELNAALAGEDSLRRYLSEQREALLATTSQTMHDVVESLLSPVDKAALTGDLVEWIHAATTRGLEAGYDGWLDDDAATVRPWGFDLSKNRVPVLIQAGEQDRFVPYAHAQWLVDNIPETSDGLSADDGHLTLLTDFQRTVRWLRGHN
jgi:pimeloyl-ACP methyl ester carboxylesterase